MAPRGADGELEKQIRQRLSEELAKKGTPQPLRREEVTVTRHDNRITARWRDFEVSAPAPSQKALDSTFKTVVKNVALVLAGGLVAIAGVVVGVGLSSGGRESDRS